MEEIKIRGFSDLTQEMSPPMTFLGWLDAAAEVGQKVGSLKRATHFMLFTGLIDKNGREIYEGDIVKSIVGNREVIGAMYYNKTKAQFGVDAVIDTDGFVPSSIEVRSPPEIIGNIYENPGLLKDSWEPND